jgi:hypothetical protein
MRTLKARTSAQQLGTWTIIANARPEIKPLLTISSDTKADSSINTADGDNYHNRLAQDLGI